MDAALVRLVWNRARNCCEYCQMSQEFDDTPFEIDHVVSRRHEGLTVAGNLALSCFYCNSYKGTDIAGRDRVTGRISPLFNPRRQKWSRHFRWEGAYLRGLTPSGRVTVAHLRINSHSRVALRGHLIEAGLFPPE